MPTVVDSLVVKIGLDPSEFKKGQREVDDAWKKSRQNQEKQGKAFEASNQKLLEGFNKLKLEALGFFAALAGAREIKEFISQVNMTNVALGNMSAKLGENPQMLSAWGMAIKRMGGDSSEAATSINNIAKAFYNLKYNGQALPPEVYRVFAMAGKPVPTTADSLDSFLNKTAAALKELAAQDRTAAYFFGEGMGLSDSMINRMIKYGSAISDVVAANKGLAPTDKQLQNSQELVDKWEHLSDTVVAIGRDIEDWFSPAFKSTLDTVQKVFDHIHEGLSFNGDRSTVSPAKRHLMDTFAPKGTAPTTGGSEVSKSNPLPVEVVPKSGGQSFWDWLTGGSSPAAAAEAPGGGGGGGGSGGGGGGGPWRGKGAPPIIRRRGGHSNMTSAPVDIDGQTIPGFTKEETESYLNILGNRESGNRYIGNNAFGFGGRWQMGNAEVRGTGAERNADWYANKGGVQDRSMMRYTLQHYNQLVEAGVIKPGMSHQEIAGHLAAAHLGGVGGAIANARGQGRSDANGTSTSSYYRMMSGLGGQSAGSSASGGSGPIIFGDSIASGLKDYGKTQGAAVVGMGSGWIMNQIRGFGGDLKGRKIVLSSGASNSHDPDALAGELMALRAKGVDMKNVTILGVGDRSDFAGYNDRLKALADKAGAAFQPITPGPDHVHPESYKKLWEGIPALNGTGPVGPQSSLSTLHKLRPVMTSQTSNRMHIGAIHVNAPHATDADGIAAHIHDALGRYQLSMSGQSGQV